MKPSEAKFDDLNVKEAVFTDQRDIYDGLEIKQRVDLPTESTSIAWNI